MQSWIGLLDCNNFFVSCERLFRPDLKGRPVVVLSSNDGCVVARSQEIKDKGIPMGIPYFQIKDIIKDIEATTFSSHFALYRDISRRVFEVMRKELDIVEQYSVDEAFFTCTGEMDEIRERVVRLKDRVEREVGIPVSIGVARSKTQAKYANGVAKRTNGIFLLSREEWGTQLSSIALRDLWGVGSQSAQAYSKRGLSTVADLLKLERRQVQELFGVTGVRLWQELQSIPSSVLSRRVEMQQSILSSRSFRGTTSDISVLQDAVAYHVREAAEDLRSMRLKTACIQVTLGTSRHGDYLLQGGTAAIDLEQPTGDTFVLLRAATVLVEALYKADVPYKKAGILLSNFVPETINQLGLFAAPETEKTHGLMPVIDAINKRSGRDSILLGTRLKAGKWQASQESKSPAYTTDWSAIAVVKA